MKISFRKSALLMLCCILASVAQDEMKGLKTRIGILNPAVEGGGEKLASEVLRNLKESVSAIGGYDIYMEEGMHKAFDENKMRFPKYCREPRCVAAVGSTLQLDRMIYGSIDKAEKTFGINLTLVDVASKQVIEKVSIESDPGIGLADAIRVAVSRLHGHVDTDLDTNTHTYYGKQINNLKQLYISSGACIAAGLLWAIINNEFIDGEKKNYGGESGVGTGSYLIPMFARPAALGNCYIAASDDAYGVFYNPAGMSWASGGEVSFGYQNRFGMLNNFAASFVNKATREIGFGQGFQYTGDNEDLYHEITFISGISYKFNDFVPFLRPFSVGLNLKIMSMKTGDGSVGLDAQKGSGFGFGLDLGFQIELSEKIRGAVLLKNTPTIVKYNNATENNLTEYNENAPVELSLGGSFQASYETFLICEGHIPLYKEQVWKGACGVERIIFRVMRVRIGVEKSEGFDTPWKINGGFGLNFPTESFLGKYFILDSSYEFNTLSPFSNVLNFSFRFGF